MCFMSLDQAVDLVRHTLILALLTAAPMLIIGLVVGLAISLFQAVTQIHEQTLTFIPKIVAMVAAAVFMLPWTAQRLVEYAAAMFSTGQLP
jgi:flagellar biosynthetic protein FliQ